MIYIICDSPSSCKDIVEVLSVLYPEYPLPFSFDISSIPYECVGSYICYILPHDGDDIFLCDTCTSTQEIAKMLFTHGLLTSYGLVLSITQTKGRGQHGHEWISYRGNVNATLCLPPHSNYIDAQTTVLLGAILTHFLRTLGVQAYNKWVNDIIVENKKVGGLLLEQDGTCLLLGIGINLCDAPPIETALNQAIALSHHVYFPYSPVACMYAFRAFLLMKEDFLLRATREEKQEYIECYLAYKEKNITLEIKEGEIVFGRIVGIGDDGSLILVHNDTFTYYTHGHISSVLE